MFNMQLKTPGKILRQQRESYERANRRMNRAVETEIKPELQRRVYAAFRVPVPKPRYPLRWRSDRQRRYVMMKLRKRAGKGGKIGYVRTGRLQNSWQVDVSTGDNGGLIEVSHPWKGVLYVTGEGSVRQPMFPQWYNAPEILREEQRWATNELKDLWQIYGT